MNFLVYLSIILFFLKTTTANVIENGDFESGTADPWFCAASKCTVVDGVLGKIQGTLDNNLTIVNSFLEVTNRNANWAGARQDLNVDSFSEDNLQLWFNFSIQANQQVI